MTKNEIVTALNKPDGFILAIVEVKDDSALKPKYVRRPCVREPDFAAASVNYKLEELLENATEPK